MNLTEPQAGSDLAAVRTQAVPQGDGTYKLFGQKIFITFGEHDYTENIIHLVLARTPDAPEGVKGISLFVVPKFLVNDDGSLGARNDVHCVSIEHKLGIHASPTAVLAYGDKGGAIGYLVGEENRGLEYMFIMMNLARFSVGMEGVGHRRARVPARGRLRARSRPGQGGRDRAGRAGRPDHRPSGHPADAADDARLHRGDARGRLRHRGGDGPRAPRPRRGGEEAPPGVRRVHDPDRQGLVDRDRAGGHVPRRAGARRHGLHRGDRRRAVLPRRADHHDLRRHDGHPGQRPHRAQDGARRRGDGRLVAAEIAQGRRRARRASGCPRSRRSASAWPRPPRT